MRNVALSDRSLRIVGDSCNHPLKGGRKHLPVCRAGLFPGSGHLRGFAEGSDPMSRSGSRRKRSVLDQSRPPRRPRGATGLRLNAGDATLIKVRETLSADCHRRRTRNTTDYCGAIFEW
jgi:hypothetical protein